MKGKMDGVARRADEAAQKLLPERPHHLCIDKRRYPNPSGFWYSGQSAGLQYMTYLSDADRGVLLTMPYFEKCDEPDTLKPPKAAARGEAKKKMTFKDYQNRKKSVSPTESDALAKLDSQKTGAAAPKESGRSEDHKSGDRDGRDPARPEKSRQEAQYVQSKNSPLPKPAPNSARASESRKRHSDIEQASPPQKKIKTEAGARELDSSRTPRSDHPKARDSANGKSTYKETMAANPHTATNGRAHLGNSKGRASPASSIHVNGNMSRSRSASSPPPKADSAMKPAVPELLSPLRIGIDDELDTPKKTTGKPSERGQKNNGRSRSDSRPEVPELLSPLRIGPGEERSNPGKKPVEKGGGARMREAGEPSPLKKPKRPFELPPLLSPTLPPLIEAELVRVKKSSGEDSSQGESLDSESPFSSGKPAKARSDEDREKRPSRIVVLKYKKRAARIVTAILALPSKSHKEALKKDRSLSLERTPPPIHARKRPLPTDEQIPESSSKRSKSTAEPPLAKPGVPSTPLKNTATAMSRVTSSNSQAHTPGDSTNLTPSVADRPLTSSDNADHANGAKAATLRQRHIDYTHRGSDLKHSRDDILRKRGSAPLTAADEKRIAALHFEMILAYMVSFSALNQARTLDRKVADFKIWETLLPHFPELKHRIWRCRPLVALAVQMHAVCLEQITQAFMTLDPTSVTVLHSSWAKLEKRRVPTWTEAATLLEEVPDSDGMKASIGPWTPVDEAVAHALAIMRRWADKEEVNWRPAVVVPMASHS